MINYSRDFMDVLINDQRIEVIIIRKKTNKNTYLRVKEDGKIYITTNNFVTLKAIMKIIKDNENYVIEALRKKEKEKKYNEKFYYLGKEYDIIYMNSSEVTVGEEKIFMSKKIDPEKWLKKQAQIIFKEELDKIFNTFPLTIPYPTLTIRSMKTRWGVCNVKTKRVTLNFNLIKRDIRYLDYVIVHELSHLIYPDHSKDFWNLVSDIEPNYKELRKGLNDYE